MKKLFSLLFVALLAMTAWGTTVTFVPGTTVGNNTQASGEDSMTLDGVTISTTSGGLAAAEYRFASGSTTTISSTVGNITSIEFTCTAQNTTKYGPGCWGTQTGEYVYDGYDGLWTGSAASIAFVATQQVRCTQIVVTVDEGETPPEPEPQVAAPVFNPADGHHFTGSLEATVSCETENASIQLYKVVDGEFEYVQDFFPGQGHTFYVTETTQYAAYAYKNGMSNSDTTYVTYTLDNDNPDPQIDDFIKFDHADDATTERGEFTVTRNGASMTVSDGMVAAESYRIYKNANVTITSTVGNITKIEFDGYNSSNKISNFGDVEGMTYEGNNGTWEGNAESVTFTASVAQVRATEIRVYVEGGAPITVIAPTFDPSDGYTFDTESLDVTINCSTQGATIHYVVDNGDELTGTAPVVVTLTESATITAYAVLQGVESDIVEATYTKVAPVEGEMITFNSETDKGDGTTTRAPWTVVKDGVTMACSDGTVYDEGYRMYQGSTLTFTSTAGNILKIEFDGVESYPVNRLTANAGNFATSGVDGVWTGQITEVVFTATAQARASEIRVYVDGDTTAQPPITVAAPVISPAHNTTFVNSQDVTITCETTGAQIFYGFDNETWTEYTAPFTINEACTVYAFAQIDTVKSATVSAKYYKATEVANIAEANDLDNGTHFAYNGEAIVTYQWYNTKNQYYSTWIKDATGYGLIYGKAVPELTQGVVLNEGWMASKTTYNGIPEFQYPTNVTASEDVVTVTPVEKTELAVADVNMYVNLKGQTITASETDTTGRTFVTADNLVIFNQFGVELPTFEEGKTYDVVGIVTLYNEVPELYIISATEVEVPAYELGDVNHDGNVNIADVTGLINLVLSKTTEFPVEADVNGDGILSVADVTMLIGRVLRGTW